jgi:hypothetical protein
LRSWARFATLLVICAVRAAPAQAQVDDTGVRVGRLRIHPRMALSYSFDSNVFLREDGEGPGPTSASRLHIQPGVSLSTAPGSPVYLSFGVGADYQLYLSDDSNLKNLSDAAVTVDLDATFNPEGAVTFSILDYFRRTVAAPTLELPRPFNRDLNKAGAKVGIAPGGKALTFDLYYFFTLDHFENYGFGSSAAQSLDNKSHDVILRSRWKFLPKTAFVSEIIGSFWRWEAQAFNNADLLRIYAGVVGNFTPRLTVSARLGYGNSFHGSGPSFNSVVGDLEVGYLLVDSVNARLNYARDFYPAYWGNFFDNHRVGLGIDAIFWRKLLLSAGVAYNRLGFGANPDPALLGGGGATLTSTDVRADNFVSANLNVTFAIQRWLRVLVGYLLEHRTSNVGLRFTGPRGTVVDGFGYLRHVLTVGMSGTY